MKILEVPLPPLAGLRVDSWRARQARCHAGLLHLDLEYLERHPDGYRYTRFCNLYRRWLKCRVLSMRKPIGPAEKMFVDYAGQKPSSSIPLWARSSG